VVFVALVLGCNGTSGEPQVTPEPRSPVLCPTDCSVTTPGVAATRIKWIALGTSAANAVCALGERGELACVDTAGIPQLAQCQGFVSVAAGLGHFCAVHSCGRVYCWGDASHGAIGVIEQQTYERGIRVESVAGAREVASGTHATCAITSSEAWCWGSGPVISSISGRRRALPTRVSGISNPRGLGMGADFACVVEEDGEVRCWGSNETGAVGQPLFTPVAVPAVLNGVAARRLAVGPYGACASTDHEYSCWGLIHPRSPPVAPDWVRPSVDATLPGLGTLAIEARGLCALLPGGGVVCRGDVPGANVPGDAVLPTPRQHDLHRAFSSVDGIRAIILTSDATWILDRAGNLRSWHRSGGAQGRVFIGPSVSTNEHPL
jgi:hypothetical protein